MASRINRAIDLRERFPIHEILQVLFVPLSASGADSRLPRLAGPGKNGNSCRVDAYRNSARAGDVTPSEFDRVERALVDASTRTPVLMFYFTAIGWLLFGTLFGFLTSIRMHTPDWLSDVSFLTWGRIRPVHMNVMVYGWACLSGMGTLVWLMARLCRTTLRSSSWSEVKPKSMAATLT